MALLSCTDTLPPVSLHSRRVKEGEAGTAYAQDGEKNEELSGRKGSVPVLLVKFLEYEMWFGKGIHSP